MINPGTISWTGATTREDGTPYPSTERQGYNVYIEPTGTPPSTSLFTAISEVNDFSMPVSDLGAPLTEGAYDMYITDLDKQGRESAHSSPISFSVVVALPKPPTGLVAS